MAGQLDGGPAGWLSSMARSPTNGWLIAAMLTSRSLIRAGGGRRSRSDVTPALLSSGDRIGTCGSPSSPMPGPGAPVPSVTGMLCGPCAVVKASVAFTSSRRRRRSDRRRPETRLGRWPACRVARRRRPRSPDRPSGPLPRPRTPAIPVADASPSFTMPLAEGHGLARLERAVVVSSGTRVADERSIVGQLRGRRQPSWRWRRPARSPDRSDRSSTPALRHRRCWWLPP